MKLTFSAASVQTGQVMADAQLAHIDHGTDGGRVGKLDLRALHYHLHIRRHGHATLRQELLG